MNREELFAAIGRLDASFVSEAIRYAPERASGSPERIVIMKKRILGFALAAVLLLALGVTAYAVWNIHTARQQALKEDLRIEEMHADAYVEYDVPDGQEDGLVLLSAINDGLEERVYVNISPVSREEAAAFPASRFAWYIEGTEIGGFAAPQLPAELSLSGDEELREAVLEHAYDSETRTLTLQCYIDVKFLDEAAALLGAESLPLRVRMIVGEDEPRSFGPVLFTPTEKQSRYFDFGNARYHDAALDREIEILGLELTPFSAVWHLRYDAAEALHRPGADWDDCKPWAELEDKVGIESELIFSDGSRFSTGGALTCPIEDGVVKLNCGWGAAIDISDVQRIVLGDLILWEAD